MTRVLNLIFRLYERRSLRDRFYTAAFLIFVPVGLRFAVLAWRYGSWVDKPLAVIAGLFIGITALVTLLRFWSVAPRRVATPAALLSHAATPVYRGGDVLSASRRRAAENRAMASAASALGSTRGRRW